MQLPLQLNYYSQLMDRKHTNLILDLFCLSRGKTSSDWFQRLYMVAEFWGKIVFSQVK